MGMFATIAAQLIFNTSGAIKSNQRFVAQVKQTKVNIDQLQKQATAANVPLNQFLRIMSAQNKGPPPTQLQKNVRLTSEAVNSFTRLLRESRLAVHQLFSLMGSGPPHHHIQSVTSHVQKMSVSFTEAKHSFRTMLEAMGVGLESMRIGLGEGGGGGGIGETITEWIRLASVQEGARVTFDAMLGSASKSEELMHRITKYAADTPFTRTDTIAASRRLLSITGENIDQNERLFRLSGQVAALRPGSSMDEVARGVVSATNGEFEILKGTFGIVLNAKMFAGYGEKGGKAYVEAVTKEVERQLAAKTGGRDLVAALGATLMGRASTLQDNLEMIGEFIGEKLTDALDLKGTLEGLIGFFDQVNRAIHFFLHGSFDDSDLTGVGEFAIAIGEGVAWVIEKIKWARTELKAVAAYVSGWLDSLGRGAVTGIVGLFGAFLAGSTGMSALSVAAGAALAVVGPLVAIMAPFAEFILPALAGGFLATIGTVTMMIPIVTAMATALTMATFAFLSFKRPTETVGDAIVRLGKFVWSYLVSGFRMAVTFLTPFYHAIMPGIQAAIDNVSAAFIQVSGPIGYFFGLFNSKALFSMDEVAMAGQNIGWILSNLIVYGSWAAAKAIRVFGAVLKALVPTFAPFVSDLYRVASAIVDVFAGMDVRQSLKVIMEGVLDILTYPFRAFFVVIANLAKTGLAQLAEDVRPWSTTIANKIGDAANALGKIGDTVNEGFLNTSEAFKGGLNVNLGDFEITSKTPVNVNVDGQKVAETLVTTEVRARNSGRGGDPVTPEEMGFVIEGGTRIRPVLPNEVAKDL